MYDATVTKTIANCLRRNISEVSDRFDACSHNARALQRQL